MERNIWLDGVMGLVVGDALGCPVQFLSREEIKNRHKGPVKGMENGGIYAMPEGTWTDDSSMSIATLSSIIEKGSLVPEDIMKRFVGWNINGEYTPFGKAFDQGRTCLNAIYNFIRNPDIGTCGLTDENSNGNGSLMRIMPVCIYYYANGNDLDEAIHGIHIVSGLTHNHLRSKMCCGIYYFCVKNIIDGYKQQANQTSFQTSHISSLQSLLQKGINEALEYYGCDSESLNEMRFIGRLFDLDEFKKVPEFDIQSTGYVIDSIEASIWCLINSDSYKECLLKAVNLGDDTDTIAAIAGGLAGLYYGYEEIPVEWRSVIKRRKWIEDLCIKCENLQ